MVDTQSNVGKLLRWKGRHLTFTIIIKETSKKRLSICSSTDIYLKDHNPGTTTVNTVNRHQRYHYHHQLRYTYTFPFPHQEMTNKGDDNRSWKVNLYTLLSEIDFSLLIVRPWEICIHVRVYGVIYSFDVGYIDRNRSRHPQWRVLQLNFRNHCTGFIEVREELFQSVT